MNDIVERLRGIYRIPITDGLGPVGAGEEPNNPHEFVRRFETPPIQHEAADVIEGLRRAFFLPDSERRQMFIRERLEISGCFNRSDICCAFAVSVPQASADIGRFMKENPGIAGYNSKTKRFERLVQFVTEDSHSSRSGKQC